MMRAPSCESRGFLLNLWGKLGGDAVYYTRELEPPPRAVLSDCRSLWSTKLDTFEVVPEDLHFLSIRECHENTFVVFVHVIGTA